MGRKYVSKPGIKKRQFNYPLLDDAKEAIESGSMTINEASVNFKIPRSTLHDKLRGKYKGIKPGRRTALSSEVEKKIVQFVLTTACWGFPQTNQDLANFVRHFLVAKDIKVNRFADGFTPGNDWTKSFLERHKTQLSERFANNIKRARAQISDETLDAYFDELQISLDDLASNAIFNYDESNLSDDPGKKKFIFKRGVKYPDRVINHTKSSISIMMCGSADGCILPPFVVYKAKNVHPSWKINGPVGDPCCSERCCKGGTRYSVSKSGWFDSTCFAAWFIDIFLPHARKIPGKKALIGDNLSSHFSPEVLEKCVENDILFICLPANATHLCQPLDVALFGPMKRKWREILHDYKTKNPSASAVQKPKFPGLFKRLLKEMRPTIKTNMISGFKTCGIYPVNRDAVKVKLEFNQVNETPDNSEVISFLRQQRGLAPLAEAGPSAPATEVGPSAPATEAGPTAPAEEAGPSAPATEAGPTAPAEEAGPSAPPEEAGPSAPRNPNIAPTRKRKSSKSVTPGKAINPEDLLPTAPVTKRARATSILRKKKVIPLPIPAPPIELPSSGECIVVQYVVRKKIIKYAAIVTNVINNDINVNFLKAVNLRKTIFILKEGDTSWETLDDVVESKVPYIINNRGQYVFENPVNVN